MAGTEFSFTIYRDHTMTEGALIFTDQGGDLVNKALGLKWTHVLIHFNGWLYEATWPRVRRTCLEERALKKATAMEFFYGDYSKAQLSQMETYAWLKLGTPYSFWGYFFPKLYTRTHGVYCSQYACEVLRAGGVNIPIGAGWSPDKLLKTMTALKKQEGQGPLTTRLRLDQNPWREKPWEQE